jgi:hypothetical protein
MSAVASTRRTPGLVLSAAAKVSYCGAHDVAVRSTVGRAHRWELSFWARRMWNAIFMGDG